MSKFTVTGQNVARVVGATSSESQLVTCVFSPICPSVFCPFWQQDYSGQLSLLPSVGWKWVPAKVVVLCGWRVNKSGMVYSTYG